jgi:hypothetical protein
MVVVEEQHDQKAQRKGDEYPFDPQVPEVNEPAARYAGVERAMYRYVRDICTLQTARKMREANPG